MAPRVARMLRGFGGAGLVAALLLPAAASTQDGDDGSGPTIRLIEQAGGVVVACSFVIDLPDLGGRKRIEANGHETLALCQFEGE